MSLKETLFQDMKESMKNKETIRKNTIQLIRGGILQIEKDKQVELDDEGVLEVIVKELKKRRDSLPDFEKSGRTDLVESLNEEIKIILGYLPTQLSEDEVKKIVEEAIKEVGATTMKDMGKVMGFVTPQVKGKADNKIVSAFIKELLTK